MAMSQAIVVRGRYANQQFTPEEPLPTVEGNAELIVYPKTQSLPSPEPGSIFELFGKAPVLRSKEDIEEQLGQEREEWGEP